MRVLVSIDMNEEMMNTLMMMNTVLNGHPYKSIKQTVEARRDNDKQAMQYVSSYWVGLHSQGSHLDILIILLFLLLLLRVFA